MPVEKVLNYINGKWQVSESDEVLDILNPASGDVFSRVNLSTSTEVDHAVTAAINAFSKWRKIPATERIQYLFKL
ncbi:MAG: aldehyde dehydrogenase family protein, partial [Anaerolineales bacterium]